jgi:outer membrane lipoprotein carrier protein
VIRETGSEGGLAWLSLSPKTDTDTGFKTARLGFNQSGLAQMQVEDALGQRTLITFSNWKRNPTFTSGTFRYVPAKGVDVVGD